MARPAAMADATFIIYSFKLESHNFQRLLRNLFSEILISTEVKRELLKTNNDDDFAKRQRFLDELPISSGYYKLCTSYDTIIFDEVSKLNKIDPGEAESIAQMRKRGIRFILSDDKGVHNLPKSFRDLRPLNMPAIIALLDMHGLIRNYTEFVRGVHNCRPLSTRGMRDGRLTAAKHLGTNITEAQIDERSDLRRLGIIK